MIERAVDPGIAADLDLEKIASVLPMVKKKAREMQAEGERFDRPPRVAVGRRLRTWPPHKLMRQSSGSGRSGLAATKDGPRGAKPSGIPNIPRYVRSQLRAAAPLSTSRRLDTTTSFRKEALCRR